VDDAKARGLSRDALDSRLFTLLTAAAVVPAIPAAPLAEDVEPGFAAFGAALLVLGLSAPTIELSGPTLRLRVFGDENHRRPYVAIDDGASSDVRALLVKPELYTGLAHGEVITARATRNLRYARSIDKQAAAGGAGRLAVRSPSTARCRRYGSLTGSARSAPRSLVDRPHQAARAGDRIAARCGDAGARPFQLVHPSHRPGQARRHGPVGVAEPVGRASSAHGCGWLAAPRCAARPR
jgi:hypothetical protein